jgi:hypothetical protein
MHQSWTFPPIGFVTARRKSPEELSEYPLYRDYQATGKFWLPSAPEQTWWGEMLFRPGDGVSVTLDDPPAQWYIPAEIEVPILCGLLSDGTPCTVLGGRAYVETYYRERQYYRATVFGQYFLGGVHLIDPADPQITSIHCQFTHLNEWFGSPYVVKHEDKMTRSSILFQPSEFALQLEARGVSFELRCFCRRSVPRVITATGRNWSYDYCFYIHPTAPQGLAWFLAVAATVRRCTIFLIGSAVYTPRLDPIFVDRSNEGNSEGIPGYLLQAVDIPSFIRTDAHYFSTLYSDIATMLPQVIRAWFRHEEQLDIVMRAYAETLLNDGAYEESVFLGVVQILEYFHGILFPKAKYFKSQVWKAFLSRLNDFIPSALVEAGVPEAEVNSENTQLLVNRIGSLNQWSLQTKLEDLFQRIPISDLMPILGNPREPKVAIKEFARGVSITRHFLTHHDERQARKAFSETDLRRAVSSCWAVLTYWLARQLEIDEKQAGDMALKAKNAMFLTAPRTGL